MRRRDDIAVEQTPDAVEEVQRASERALAISNIDRESKQLKNARAAVRRIHDGSFGICEECEDEIPRSGCRQSPGLLFVWSVRKHSIACSWDRHLTQVSTAVLLKLCPFFFALGCMCFAQPVNWTGPYEPCRNSAELKGTGHLHIGVRYDVSDPAVIQQFHKAFEFWSKVLNADFYDEQSTACRVAIVEGTNTLLGDLVVARAQIPDRPNFEGWIAVEPTASASLAFGDAVATSVARVAHVFH